MIRQLSFGGLEPMLRSGAMFGVVERYEFIN